jgi:hypothetical protein
LEPREGEEVSENKVEKFMKKHPPWFMFDFHPIRSARKLSEEEEKIKKEMSEVMGKETEASNERE